MKRTIFAMLLLLAVLVVGFYALAVFGISHVLHKTTPLEAITPTMNSQTLSDVTYCSPEQLPQKLDLYIPQGKQGTTFPLLIYIHGGSWVSGSKDEEAVSQYLPALAQTGYVVASINYRLAPQFTFPTQVEDVKCAIRFMRNNANKYHVQTNNVALIGESAGGYLAAFAGVTGDAPQFKTNEYKQASDRVQAVVDIAGPTDFTATDASATSIRIAQAFLGNASPITASPTTYVHKGDPPFLILHGQEDTVVPPSQSQKLQEKLAAEGTSAQLILVQNAGHTLNATSVQPSFSQLALDIATFLQKQLKQ